MKQTLDLFAPPSLLEIKERKIDRVKNCKHTAFQYIVHPGSVLEVCPDCRQERKILINEWIEKVKTCQHEWNHKGLYNVGIMDGMKQVTMEDICVICRSERKLLALIDEDGKTLREKEILENQGFNVKFTKIRRYGSI